MSHWLDSIKYSSSWYGNTANVPAATSAAQTKDEWQKAFFGKKVAWPPELLKLEETTSPLLGRLYRRYFQGVKDELKTQALLLGVTSLDVNIHLCNVMYPVAGTPFEKASAYYDGIQSHLNFMAPGGPRGARTTGKSMAHAMLYGKAIERIIMDDFQLVQATRPRAPMIGPVARKPFNQAPRQSFKALIRQSRGNR